MDSRRILPFYMTYPMPMFYEEDMVMRDLDYLQQMYPAQAKKYQRKIAAILDKMDYRGSMIYDEYPDKFMMNKLARDITEILKQEEMMEDMSYTPQQWETIGDMIQLLLFYEIYKRRHNNSRGILKF
ncbi:MAG: hypothetical protein IJ485_05260 [Lachnospiraceae bacterium]|nr:hypothetical protein [Lachnospiraceae bacterium]